jgi:hypothetical protein
MSKKLQRAYELIQGKFSPPAEDIYQHSMLVAAKESAKGKDSAILKKSIAQSKAALLNSAKSDLVLAQLLEQMANHPTLELSIIDNKSKFGA